jgi:hypothetical protein
MQATTKSFRRLSCVQDVLDSLSAGIVRQDGQEHRAQGVQIVKEALRACAGRTSTSRRLGCYHGDVASLQAEVAQLECRARDQTLW